MSEYLILMNTDNFVPDLVGAVIALVKNKPEHASICMDQLVVCDIVTQLQSI